jgi:hypothetical protein
MCCAVGYKNVCAYTQTHLNLGKINGLLAVNCQTTIQTRKIVFYALGSTLRDWGKRGASPAAAWRRPQPCSQRGRQRRPSRQRAASWKTAREGEHPLASVQQQHRKDAVLKGAPCEQQWSLEAVRTTPIFNTTAITPKILNCWVRIQQVHLGQQLLQVSLTKKKARGLRNKTDLLCEETEGNKSTSPDYILIHHQPFALREAASVTYPIF